MMGEANLLGASPFLIVSELSAALDCYRDRLGFEVELELPPGAPFFAIVRREGASFLLKEVGMAPEPNPRRHPDARWDVFVATRDPDALHEELVSRGATIHRDLADTDDGLRCFEVEDADGHVLCFGRPRT
ncbi:MAG: VOC family protein [Acidobacteriota bacterium]